MDQRIELYGIARLIAGRKELTVALAEGATVGDALRALALAVPNLVGSVLSPEGDVVEGNVLSLGGRAFVADRSTPLSLDVPLLILPAIAGG